MKRVLSIQDISCFGKCSLTAALPIISAMGVETAIIPTAILSTHTGGFPGYTFHDLTDEIRPITDHWKSIPLRFDAIYTGYLGSIKQVDIVSGVLDDFGKDSLCFIDPVMADHGRLYAGFTDSFVQKMSGLCAKADVIVPNITEACVMLKKPFHESGYTEEYICDLLTGLRTLGAKNCILTGVSFQERQIGAALLAQGETQIRYYFSESIPMSFHGTGDVFASCCVGALMNGLPIGEALQCAVDFTAECARRTINDENHRYSVKFEECIPYLLKKIRLL